MENTEKNYYANRHINYGNYSAACVFTANNSATREIGYTARTINFKAQERKSLLSDR
jgi:hypothetical protein